MEVLDSGAVSLDELTLDLSEGNGQKVIANPPFELNTASHCLENTSAGKYPDQWNGNHENRKNQYEVDFTTTYNDNRPFENTEDFEVDVPPLSLFPSSKENASDDSDFEFEIHERQKVLELPSIKSDAKDKEPVEVNAPVELEPNEADDFQPEILTPRDKIKGDILFATADSGYNNSKLDSDNTAAIDSYLVHGKDHPTFTGLNFHVPHIDERETQKVTKFDHPSEPVEFNETPEKQRPPDIVTTSEDWEDVQVVEPGFAIPGEKLQGAASNFESKPLQTFENSWKIFEAADYSSVKDDIRPRIQKKGFSALTHLLFGPPKLQNELTTQRDTIFCIAATQFNNDDKEHCNVLQTIYRCLTGSKFDCQRFGNHWEEIGFQGRDPATDLRGTGMLALLHLLFFLRDPSTKDLARDVYKLSLHPTQNFPFCIMGINLSRICIQVLREEVYNRECNKRKDVMGTLNTLYAALYLKLYQLWKPGKTIADSGFVLKEIENYSRKNSKSIFKDLETFEKTKKQQGPFGEPVEVEPSFFNVCKEDKCDNKSTAELY